MNEYKKQGKGFPEERFSHITKKTPPVKMIILTGELSRVPEALARSPNGEQGGSRSSRSLAL